MSKRLFIIITSDDKEKDYTKVWDCKKVRTLFDGRSDENDFILILKGTKDKYKIANTDECAANVLEEASCVLDDGDRKHQIIVTWHSPVFSETIRDSFVSKIKELEFNLKYFELYRHSGIKDALSTKGLAGLKNQVKLMDPSDDWSDELIRIFDELFNRQAELILAVLHDCLISDEIPGETDERIEDIDQLCIKDLEDLRDVGRRGETEEYIRKLEELRDKLLTSDVLRKLQ